MVGIRNGRIHFIIHKGMETNSHEESGESIVIVTPSQFTMFTLTVNVIR